MEQQTSPILLVARKPDAVTLDGPSAYAPTEFHGTIHWVELTPPSASDPRHE